MSKNQVYDTNNDVRLAEEKLRASDGDLQQEAQVNANETTTGGCPFGHSFKGALPYHYVPLRMGGRGGTHMVSEGSRALIDNEVTLDDLKTMTDAFYELAFQDQTLDKLIRSHSDPHGDRFAKWIHQKLSGSNVWDLNRRSRDKTPVEVAGGRTVIVHDRSSAHVAAWFSPKRTQSEVGQHFKLDECRVWMRLHFYALRKTGMTEKSPSFADYYVRFIGHFISVYEGAAPMFARDSFRWSGKPANVEKYIRDGRVMRDVLGRTYSEATRDLPEDELYDDEWPYFVSQ